MGLKQALFTFFLSLFALSYANVDYIVEIKGVDDKNFLSCLHSVSHSAVLQNKPAPSLIALRLRAEADVERFQQALQSRAYYEADVDLEILEEGIARVIFTITPEEIYRFGHFYLLPTTCMDRQDIFEPEPEVHPWIDEEDDEEIQWTNSSEEADETCGEEEEEYLPSPFDDIEDSVSYLNALSLHSADLGIVNGEPAYPQKILNAEDRLVYRFRELGFPLAKIAKREVIADVENKRINIVLYVASGPLSYFGDVRIIGNKQVCSSLIKKHVHWKFGQRYIPRAVECTAEDLECTGLFRSVEIGSDSSLDEDGYLPMLIQVCEAQHRSIGAGLSYDTQQGGGAIFEWENRNIRGMGELLSVKTELMQKIQKGTVYYRKPDFGARKQDLISKMEFEHEDTRGFNEASFSFTSKISREINPCLHISGGLGYKYLNTTDSDYNHHFSLIKIPLQLHWNTASSPLDPLDGFMVNAKATPTLHAMQPDLGYYILTLDAAYYLPIPIGKCTLFAFKASIGSILGASRKDIPPPERFYTGTPTTLRGYNYMTVSPLDQQNNPIGGRSMMVYSFELRTHFTECWGGVLFYEIGNVDDKSTPQFDAKQLSSAGFGVRYFTAVGPLRFDFAFPLNRRPDVDKQFQFYFSIGQSF